VRKLFSKPGIQAEDRFLDLTIFRKTRDMISGRCILKGRPQRIFLSLEITRNLADRNCDICEKTIKIRM
jgi:hypothetical protein